MNKYARRVYDDRGLARTLVGARTIMIFVLVVVLAAATWAISEGEERGYINEAEDLGYTVLSIVLVLAGGFVIERGVVSPLVEAQEDRLRESLEKERALRLELERELAARQAFIEQANHHLRTPVTVIYGMAQLLADHGDQFDRDRRAQMRAVVLRNATTLKDIVEDLSVFLDERVAELVGHDGEPSRQSASS